MSNDDQTTSQSALGAPLDGRESLPAKAPPTAPRGFLLIIVAAMVALAGVIAASQWQVASSVARTGTTMMANTKARAIADACLEKWLRYAKDGVDTDDWDDFDVLLVPPLGTAAPSDKDFIPDDVATECTAGVTYVPQSMATAPPLRRGLYRYCAIRMDGGVCLMRFDDNSDDGKQGGVMSPDQGDEGLGAVGGDNPRKDRDFSVLVTAIGLFPAGAATPVADLYHRAEARSTKRALLQIEISASTDGWPAIHSDTQVQLHNGAGANFSVKVCGTGGGVTSPAVNGSGTPGCVCGIHRVNGTNPLDDDCSSDCGSEGCAAGVPDTHTVANNIDDDLNPDTDGDLNYDQDLPPPLPTKPPFTAIIAATTIPVAAPGNAFARNIPAQTSTTTVVPRWITGNLPDPSPQLGDPTNPICTFFFGGATDQKGLVNVGPTATIPTGQKGLPNAGQNRTPRAAYIWDHSDTDVYDTLITTHWAGAVTAANPTPPATWGAVTWPPVTPVSCRAWSDTYLPAPCNWNFTRNDTDGSVTAVQVDISKCAVPESLCWRPVSLIDAKPSSSDAWDNSPYLSGLGPGTPTGDVAREPTKESSSTEAFHPVQAFRVPLVRGNSATIRTLYQTFCGTTPGETDPDEDDNGPYFSVAQGRWRISDALERDENFNRGMYWIFDSEGNTSARAISVEEKLGDSGDRLSLGIITDGPIRFTTNSEINVCCPTCDCTGFGPAATVNQWGKSSGYFLFAKSACGFLNPPKELAGDILCEAVALNNGDDPQRIYADVFATGWCSGFGGGGCDLNTVQLPLLWGGTSQCAHTLLHGGFDDPGICFAEHAVEAKSDILSDTGPWVGHLWSQGDIILIKANGVAAPPADDAQVTTPFFPLANGHPEWPVLYAEDDIALAFDNKVWGKIQAKQQIHLGNNNRVWGRVVAKQSITFGNSSPASNGKNWIYWNGAGTSIVAVDNAVFYQDLGW